MLRLWRQSSRLLPLDRAGSRYGNGAEVVMQSGMEGINDLAAEGLSEVLRHSGTI